MFYANESQSNFTVGVQYIGIVERVLSSIVTTIPCCVFFLINCTMLFTLRSKRVFHETSRYILLFNLLSADTVVMVQSQCLYILSVCKVTLLYLLCAALIMTLHLTSEISRLTLVAMCLERYVAVCYPLRHATIITSRSTEVAVTVIWAFSSINAFIQVALRSNRPFSAWQSLQMTDYCSNKSIFSDPRLNVFQISITYFLFVSAGLVVTSSYISVMVAARSASTDKASAQKARNTLLLHLVQLGLSLCLTVHDSILFSVSANIDRIIFVRIQAVIYIFIVVLPRCLSCLIYGLRDQIIRPVLMHYLFYQWRHSVPVVSTKTKVRVQVINGIS